jgi:hypothetical protein
MQETFNSYNHILQVGQQFKNGCCSFLFIFENMLGSYLMPVSM